MTTPSPTKIYTYSQTTKKTDIPLEFAQSLDAILILGGGKPKSLATPPIWAQTRCDAAASIINDLLKTTTTSIPALLCLSAGTAHVPQLLSADGLPVWESTSSAAYLLEKYPFIPSETIYAETTSYDTISNAFFARTSFTDIVGWKRLLIVTNEFHMERSKDIFEWIFHTPTATTTPPPDYQLYYLSCSNEGLSSSALAARKEHESRGAVNIRDNLSRKYVTLRDVWAFLTTMHDFYSAEKLVEKGKKMGDKEGSEALKDSYGA